MKKRVLVIISFSFSIRYLYRTRLLHQLRDFADPVIAITWNQKDLIDEMRADGFEVHIIPESVKSINYNNVRKKIDFWFNHFRLKTPSKKIQEDWLKTLSKNNNSLLTITRKLYNVAKFYFPATIKKLKLQEKQLLLTDTNYNELSAAVEKLRVEAVFTLTPFHTQEDVLLQVCKHSGIKMLTSILSFDNITKRGWLPIEYDLYMVWNKHNHAEAIRCYQEKSKRLPISIVGAAQFDFYCNKQYVLAKEQWLQQVGLPDDDRKIILYAGGPKSLFPDEYVFLRHIDNAITNDLIKPRPKVLFRCHPVDDVQRWKSNLSDCEHIYFDTSWTGQQNLLHANISNDDIAKLCSTLAHTDVHINLCSTMTVDGSAFNKPQIAPAYDVRGKKESALLERMYYQEHFIPIINIQGVQLAHSKNELVQLINQALIDSNFMTQKCAEVIKEIITYDDGLSTQRVVAEIKKTLGS